MALLPLLTLVAAVCGAVLLQYADARYMVKSEDGRTISQKVETIQDKVNDIQSQQRVFANDIDNVKDSISEVKSGTTEINRKLDRLIERGNGGGR